MLVWCKPSDGLGLAPKPLHGLFVGDDAEPQDLQGHMAAERCLLGLVNDAHAAAAELADDPELAQGRRLSRRRAGRAVDELDAGQAGLELGGQLRDVPQKLLAVGSATRLEVGHVAVEDARQLLGRVERWRHIVADGLGRTDLLDRGVVRLSHLFWPRD